MGNIVGEPRQIEVTGLTNFDGSDVSLDDVDSVTVTIYKNHPTGEEVLPETDITGVDGVWTYVWDTTGLDPGVYHAKVTVMFEGNPTFKYRHITLKPDQP